MKYNYGADEEFVLCYKGRPFSVLSSTSMPTPTSSYIDHLLVRELGLKMSDLQCKKLSFAGVKLRLLGKVSMTVQCINEGNIVGNLHFRANVIENLYQHFDTHSIAGQKTDALLRGESTSSGAPSETSSPSRSSRSESPPVTPVRAVMSPTQSASPSPEPSPTPSEMAEIKMQVAKLKCVSSPSPPRSPPGFPVKPQFARPPSPPRQSRHGPLHCSWEQCVPIQPDCPADCGFSPQMGLPPGYQPCYPECVGAYCPCLKRMQRRQYGWRTYKDNLM